MKFSNYFSISFWNVFQNSFIVGGWGFYMPLKQGDFSFTQTFIKIFKVIAGHLYPWQLQKSSKRCSRRFCTKFQVLSSWLTTKFLNVVEQDFPNNTEMQSLRTRNLGIKFSRTMTSVRSYWDPYSRHFRLYVYGKERYQNFRSEC